jgi:TorA-specific chaperone
MYTVLQATDHAALYDGFAALFAEPLDAATIASCRERIQIVPLGNLSDAAWAQAPIARELVARVLRILHDAGDLDTTTSLLNRDFCALFLGIQGPQRVVPACQSAYLDDGTNAAAEVESCLAGNGLAIADRFVEPADHVAVQLAIMAWLLDALPTATGTTNRATIDPVAFLDNHLLSWIPAFAARCEAVDTTGCYAAFATLLHQFLLSERTHLAAARPSAVTSQSD